MRCWKLAVLTVAMAVTRISTTAGADLPKFSDQTLDPNVGNVCYALTTADVDGDKRLDIVAVTENRVVWFQNPDWKLRTIIADQTDRDNVCIAPLDIDGDGKVDFALGAGWTKIGTLQWLTRGESLDEKWQVHRIGQEGWLHRARWGDILGTGKPQLVISPLNKTTAPMGVRLQAYSIPADPKKDAWPITVIDEELNSMHNHWMGDLNGDGKEDVIAAAQEGLFLFQRTPEGFRKTTLGEGMPGKPTPQVTGAGEVKVGQLGPKQKIIATVEPMHGTSLVVYTSPPEGQTLWNRLVLDSTLKRGHALAFADLNRDGVDEIILGHSDLGTGNPAGPGVFIFQATKDDGSAWSKSIVDNGGIATEDLVVADFNNDGWPDIAAGGRASHNVKLYMNLGIKK